jgi:hypothetical protein
MFCSTFARGENAPACDYGLEHVLEQLFHQSCLGFPAYRNRMKQALFRSVQERDGGGKTGIGGTTAVPALNE